MIIILLLLIIEMRLSSKWSSLYFGNGLKLYTKQVKNIVLKNSPDEIVVLLNKSFKGNGFSQSIQFHKHDSNTVLFREKVFEFALFNYTPLMHGKVQITDSSISVIGLANWYPIAFICLWYSMILPTFRFDMDLMFVLFPIVIFGVIYYFQTRKYNKIITCINEMNRL